MASLAALNTQVPASVHECKVPSTAETLPASTTPATGSAKHKDTDNSSSPEKPVENDFGFLPIPKRVRYNHDHPARFGLWMNVIFGMASTFTISNLAYCQPLLIQLSLSFGVTYHEVSSIPTLVQAGYALGLLSITPLGDLVRRRPLILILIFTTASLSIGLAITKSVVAFEVLTFLVGIGSVVSSVLMPLAADLAPPGRRASALSIVYSGLLLGVLVARVLAGVVAQFVTWHVVYYVAAGMQYVILMMLYWMLPDYPAKNKGATYFRILYGMAKLIVTEPLLIQAMLISIPASATFTNWWVTLTFLLGGPQYSYSTVVIGLFGAVGIVGVAMAPLIGRTIDRLVPWSATLFAISMLLITSSVQTSAAGLNVAAVVLVTIGVDVFRQTQQVSLSTAVLGLDPNARSRLHACLVVAIFIGQVMGTSVGSKVFIEHGWRANAALNLAWTGFTLFVLLLRGPHCPRYNWIGWQGGFELRKSRVLARQPVGAEGPASGAGVEEEARDQKALAPSEAVEIEKGSADEMKDVDVV